MRAFLLAQVTAARFLPRRAHVEPLTSVVLLRVDPAPGSSCTVDEQLAKIDIPPLAHAQQTGFAPCGVFAGHEAQPGRQWAAVFEGSGIRHGC
jgi:hypothetical protein